MIEESKYCNVVMKKINKELLMTKKDYEDFKNSTKCWVCNNTYVDSDKKVRDQCHITGKYRGSARADCNINIKLNHKIYIVFHDLKNYDSHFIMQEFRKFHFEINFIANGLEKCMSFNFISNS